MARFSFPLLPDARTTLRAWSTVLRQKFDNDKTIPWIAFVPKFLTSGSMTVALVSIDNCEYKSYGDGTAFFILTCTITVGGAPNNTIILDSPIELEKRFILPGWVDDAGNQQANIYKNANQQMELYKANTSNWNVGSVVLRFSGLIRVAD